MEALRRKKKGIESNIECVVAKGSNYILQLIYNIPIAADSPNISHSIFHIFPSDANVPSLTTCEIDIVSRWALDILLGQYDKCKVEVRANLHYTLLPSTGADLLRDNIFETQVLNCLDVIEAEHLFSIRRLINSVQMQWLYRGPIRRFTFTKDTLTAGIANTVQKKVPVHLVPINRNKTAVGSILYGPNDPNTLTCIQIRAILSLSWVLSLFKASSNVAHRLQVSALQKSVHGTSYLLCRH